MRPVRFLEDCTDRAMEYVVQLDTYAFRYFDAEFIIVLVVSFSLDLCVKGVAWGYHCLSKRYFHTRDGYVSRLIVCAVCLPRVQDVRRTRTQC
jgi:hypothetical protein